MAIEDPSIALAFDFECAEIYQEFQNEVEMEKINSERKFQASLRGVELD